MLSADVIDHRQPSFCASTQGRSTGFSGLSPMPGDDGERIHTGVREFSYHRYLTVNKTVMHCTELLQRANILHKPWPGTPLRFRSLNRSTAALSHRIAVPLPQPEKVSGNVTALRSARFVRWMRHMMTRRVSLAAHAPGVRRRFLERNTSLPRGRSPGISGGRACVRRAWHSERKQNGKAEWSKPVQDPETA